MADINILDEYSLLWYQSCDPYQILSSIYFPGRSI